MTSKELLEKIQAYTLDMPGFVQYENGQWKFKTDKVCLTTGDEGARKMLEAFQEVANTKK